MAKQTFTTGQVLTAAQVNSLQTNDFNQTVNAKTASYVLVASDKGTRIEFNTSGSVTCTVNTGIFDAGDTLIVQNRGAGSVTITAGTATVNTSGSLVLNQYESGTLYFISASAALWFGSNPGDITGITTGATSGLTGGVTSGTADLKFNTTAKGALLVGTGAGTVTELTVGTNNFILTADSTTASGLKWLGSWTTYTPTTTGYTIGNGSQEWRYFTFGKLVHVYGSVKFGSTSSMTGALTFTLPSTISQINSQYHQIGYVNFEDAGTTNYYGMADYYSISNHVQINVFYAASTYLYGTNTNSTTPMTWAVNDSFDVMCWYQEA